jgi:deferrochelatase/peroxidase EfeB
MSSEINYSDVQGLVRFGYGWMKEAIYLLMRVKDVAAARSWLLSAPITSAVKSPSSPSTAMQVAFTAPGLKALGVSESIINAFSHEFVSGMAEPSRSRRLGDVKDNAPSKWKWGGYSNDAEYQNDARAKEKIPHLVVMLFAKEGLLKDFEQSSTGNLWNEAFVEVDRLETSNLDRFEPFGFADGISQPQIDWSQQRVSTSLFPVFKFQSPLGFQRDYTNVAALGEFLLGYRNEYGKYTGRPLVDADTASAGLLPAEDAPEKRDVGRNGTYLVMRQLHQDVRGFWKFLSQQTGGDLAEAEKLAAAMVGRTKDGDPLAPFQQEPIPGIGPDPDEIRQNQFTYDGDPEGVRCPFGAHIRRTNPRNTDFPGRPNGLLGKVITMLGFGRKGFRDDLMSSVRYHRILRRGREYGVCVSPAKAIAPAAQDEPESGIHFICLNANILRQFEFLQNAWIASTKFSGMTGESDPLLGDRLAIPGCPVTSDFNLPQEGNLRRRVAGLPQFVTVQGGAYFFLPSLRALRYFAGAKTP